MSRSADLWSHPYLRHLRLHFNLLLSPIFLWGLYLAGDVADWPRVVVAYLSLHVFLYGGTNALNSYFDRDEGPVGGMWSPPPVDAGLLRWSWLVQAIGFVLALTVSLPFALVYAALFLVATAYSHPRWRWKSHPLAAVATVALGQGGLGAIAGLIAALPPMPFGAPWPLLLERATLVGLAVAVLLIIGLYIVSQAYQTAEDRSRGDQTFPVLLGPGRAILLGTLASALGGLLLLLRLVADVGALATLPLLLLLLVIGGGQLSWAARFDEQALRVNFRRAMLFLSTGGLGLNSYLIVLLWLRASAL